MQEHKVPVLIFAQSGRYLAQSATQAAYSVWVADCFGDLDTRKVANRWQQVPPLSELDNERLLQLLTDFADGQDCLLICGSGIEKFYPILEKLPKHIQHIGNSSQTISSIKTPQRFFSLLEKFSLPYPETLYHRPAINKGWLFKETSGLGGSHIVGLSKATTTNDGYFQKQVHGISGSALFLSNGQQTQLLLINQQTCSADEASPFQLSAIETPLTLSPDNQALIAKAVAMISQEVKLLGLNSLDFIVDDNDQLFILEINPRPSASCELIDHVNLFQHHIDACQGKPLTQLSTKTSYCSGLYYLFAPRRTLIPENMIWPEHTHDLPAAGTVIETNQPICTITVLGNDLADCHQQQRQLSEKIIEQL